MRRRDFIQGIAGSTVAWPLAIRAEPPLPVIAFVSPGSPEAFARRVAAFRAGLGENGYIEGRNITIEYHWLEGQYDHVPELMADLAKRRVAVIATPGFQVASLAAKAATTTIPIVFGVAEDPVKLGLVGNLARPGGNLTGVNTFVQEVGAKRLRLLHELVPKAVRIAVLVNPNNASSAETTLRDVNAAAPGMGMQIETLRASTIGEINAAFAVMERDRFDALFVAPDGFFNSRGMQFALQTARHAIPASYPSRDIVTVGGLMSYGTDLADMTKQAGVYVGRILKGAKPSDLPVLQTNKFEFLINLEAARVLGIEVPPDLLALADEVVE